MENISTTRKRNGLQGLLGDRKASGNDLNGELAALLRNSRQQMQSGLNRVLTLEPLTTVKDLVIVGEGPAAEEIFLVTNSPPRRGDSWLKRMPERAKRP